MLARRSLLARAGLALAAQALAGLPAAAQTRPRFYQRGTTSRTVRFAGAGGATLEGTLLLPIWTELERVPGVVLVAGSGPTDRDGNNPLVPERIDLLRQVAAKLAAAGIASLRYDKRGVGGSTPMPALPPATLEEQQRFFAWENFVADVVAAHAELVRHDEVKSYATALLGHSEGGLLVLAAAPVIEKHRPHAMVLMGTPGRPLGEVLRGQIERTAPPRLVAPAERALAAIAATGQVPAGLPRELDALFPPYAGPFLQSLLGFDAAAALRASPLPCLLLQGAADRQVVPMGDVQPLVDALGQRSAPADVVVVAASSHNFKTVSSPADPGFAGPLSPAMADTLAAWLARTLGA